MMIHLLFRKRFNISTIFKIKFRRKVKKKKKHWKRDISQKYENVNRFSDLEFL